MPATASSPDSSDVLVVRPPQAATAAGDGAAAAALVALQRSLEQAGERPVLIVGDGDGFLVSGAVGDPATRALLADTCEQIAAHPQPVLAALPGPALDAGFELALACDVRFAAPATAVGFPTAAAGGLPTGGAQRLVRLAGNALAARLLLLGELPRAVSEPALSRVLSCGEDPVASALAACRELATRAPLAREAIKVALRAAEELPLPAGLAIEADLACLLLPTEDRAEGLRAHRAGEPPSFEGR